MSVYKEMLGSLTNFTNKITSVNADKRQSMDDEKEKDMEILTDQQISAIISSKYSSIVELEDSVVRSLKLANDAESSAKKAAGITVHWYGGRKEAIELLQDASEYSAKALISLAEAQKKSFEYQRKLTEITKYLFALGVSNIAMNRSVVRELELKLKGASDAEISALAKQELKNVILQLKAQEDMMKKQEFLREKVREQAGELKEIDKQIDDIAETDEEQDEKIAENAEKIVKHTEVLSEQQRKDEEHDKRISENEQDIDSLEEQDKEQDKLIAVGIEKDKEHDVKITENAQDIDELERQDEEQDKKISSLMIKINEHGRILDKHSTQNVELEQKIQGVSQNIAGMIADIKVNISENTDEVNKNIAAVERDFEKQLEDMRGSICKSNDYFDEKISNLSTELKNKNAELKSELENRTKEINTKIEDLENRISSLDMIVNKRAWKITISAIAGISLLLNILQLLGIL